MSENVGGAGIQTETSKNGVGLGIEPEFASGEGHASKINNAMFDAYCVDEAESPFFADESSFGVGTGRKLLISVERERLSRLPAAFIKAHPKGVGHCSSVSCRRYIDDRVDGIPKKGVLPMFWKDLDVETHAVMIHLQRNPLTGEVYHEFSQIKPIMSIGDANKD